MAEVKGVLVKDLEQKVSTLERANFDLKMKVYYLNEKVASGGVGGSEESQTDVSSRGKEAGPSAGGEALLHLQELNRQQAVRITELELDLVQQRSSSSRAAATPGASLPVDNASFLEENRRRERSAMQAIAEHDAAMIAQLQETLASLEQQHSEDQALTAHCTDKISRLMAEVEQKDLTVAAQAETVRQLQAQVVALDARVKHQDLLLLQKSSSAAGGSSSSGSTSGKFSSQQPEGAGQALGTFSSPSRRWSQEGAGSSSSGSSSSSSSSRAGGELAGNADGTREFLDFGVQGAWEELAALRAANKELSQEVEKREGVVRAQEEALRRVRGSVEEIAMLEAAEIARLEAEHEKALDDNDALKRDLRTSEAQIKTLTAQIEGQEDALREAERMQDEMLTMMTDREDKLRHQLAQALSRPPASPRSPKESSRGNGGGDPEVMRMYRLREAELLNALEGVVQRVHELEAQGAGAGAGAGAGMEHAGRGSGGGPGSTSRKRAGFR